MSDILHIKYIYKLCCNLLMEFKYVVNDYFSIKVNDGKCQQNILINNTIACFLDPFYIIN